MAKDMQLNELSDFLKDRASDINGCLVNAIKICCEKVRSDIQYSMAHTVRNTEKSYYTNNKTTAHHPSMPGNPPAPDTGNLRESIRYEIHGKSEKVYGVVGSTQKDPDYAVYTEYGTTKMAPRPWLRPAMQKNNDWIRRTVATAVKSALQGGD